MYLRQAVRQLVASVVIVGCGTQPVKPDASNAFCTDQPPAPTFTNVQRLFDVECVICHTTGVPLDLAAGAYAQLVGQPAPDYVNPPTMDSCGGTLVVPGDPASSYLMVKLTSPAPCAGSEMPVTDIGASAPLAPCATTMIHDWIAAGAPND